MMDAIPEFEDGTCRTAGRKIRQCKWACVAVAALCAFGLSGCTKPSAESNESVDVALTWQPASPTTGQTHATVTLTDRNGTALTGADVQLEGNMNHAGMKPSFADLAETGEGKYEGDLDFTMGGDWIVTVRATMPDGESVEKVFDVPGVVVQ